MYRLSATINRQNALAGSWLGTWFVMSFIGLQGSDPSLEEGEQVEGEWFVSATY